MKIFGFYLFLALSLPSPIYCAEETKDPVFPTLREISELMEQRSQQATPLLCEEDSHTNSSWRKSLLLGASAAVIGGAAWYTFSYYPEAYNIGLEHASLVWETGKDLFSKASSNFLLGSMVSGIVVTPLQRRLYEFWYKGFKNEVAYIPDHLRILQKALKERKQAEARLARGEEIDSFTRNYLIPAVRALELDRSTLVRSGELSAAHLDMSLADMKRDFLLGLGYAQKIASLEKKLVGGADTRIDPETLSRIKHIQSFFAPDSKADETAQNELQHIRNVINDIASTASLYSKPGAKGAVSAYYFQGPPGVGKTALVDALGWALDIGVAKVNLKGVTSTCDIFPPYSPLNWNAFARFDKLFPFSKAILESFDSQGKLSRTMIIFIDEFDKLHPEVQMSFAHYFDGTNIPFPLRELGISIDLENCIFIIAGNQTFEQLGQGHLPSRFKQIVFPALSPSHKNKVARLAFNQEAQKAGLNVRDSDKSVSEIIDILASEDNFAGVRFLNRLMKDLALSSLQVQQGLDSEFSWEKKLATLKTLVASREEPSQAPINESCKNPLQIQMEMAAAILTVPIVTELRELCHILRQQESQRETN